MKTKTTFKKHKKTKFKKINKIKNEDRYICI